MGGGVRGRSGWDHMILLMTRGGGGMVAGHDAAVVNLLYGFRRGSCKTHRCGWKLQHRFSLPLVWPWAL